MFILPLSRMGEWFLTKHNKAKDWRKGDDAYSAFYEEKTPKKMSGNEGK